MEHDLDFTYIHSPQYLEMASKLERHRFILDADGHARKTGTCGDTIEFFVLIDNGIISRVTFLAQGCSNTRACANTVIMLTEGKSVEDAWDILPENIVEYLQSLPVDDAHCAELAVGTFFLALSDFQQRQKAAVELSH